MDKTKQKQNRETWGKMATKQKTTTKKCENGNKKTKKIKRKKM